jgi:hypothetical protein
LVTKECWVLAPKAAKNVQPHKNCLEGTAVISPEKYEIGDFLWGAMTMKLRGTDVRKITFEQQMETPLG